MGTIHDITVRMLPGDHPMIYFPMAFAIGKGNKKFAGEITLSLETMKEAITLRDALSTFITSHGGED